MLVVQGWPGGVHPQLPPPRPYPLHPGHLSFLYAQNAPDKLQQMFSESRVYCGGFTAQSVSDAHADMTGTDIGAADRSMAAC